jgi:hypothetical protein
MQSCGTTPVRMALGLTLTVLLLVASGCNRPPKDVTVVGNSGNSSTTTITTPGNTPETPIAQNAPDQPPPAASDTTTGQPAGAGPVSGKVEQADLSGKWLALFGRTAGGSVDEAWKRGEVLEFKRVGELIWTKKPGDSIPFSVALNGLDLELKPGKMMNVGRDDEVGLMNVGRDDEVGLNNADAKNEAQNSDSSLKKKVFRDGNFLALIGEENDVMVFGKVGATENTSRPEVTGKYVGQITDMDTVPASFEWKQNFLSGNLAEGKGVFKAEFKDGYFIGISNGPWGNGYGAVTLRADGSLDGVTLPMPFNQMNANFDFRPGQ